eukprot:5939773-Pleurochrysis_carterae.AAC.3
MVYGTVPGVNPCGGTDLSTYFTQSLIMLTVCPSVLTRRTAVGEFGTLSRRKWLDLKTVETRMIYKTRCSFGANV